MPTIFLSHTFVDKPFVEKLAKSLVSIGVNVWYDKWEIRIGDSLLWKIEQGIRANEYLGVVLSPDAIASEWVKTELASAWHKQLQSKQIVVLPILYRDCEMPLFLADRKYADFRADYEAGFRSLATALGVNDTEVLAIRKWRLFAKAKKGECKK